MQVCYAIIFVSDMNRSIAMSSVFPFAFKLPDGLNLRPALPRSRSTRAPSQRLQSLILTTYRAGRCRPGIRVPSLEEFHKRMLANNVPIIAEPKEMFGACIAQYADPDGLSLSVSEVRR